MKVEFIGQVGDDYDGLSRTFYSRFGEGMCAQEVGGSVLFKLSPSGCAARADKARKSERAPPDWTRILPLRVWSPRA